MKLFSLLTAAAGLLFVSACASTPVPTDDRVVVATAEVSAAQPGKIYLSEEAARIYTLRDIESEINESGYLAVRVFGKTAELSALKWAFFGDIDYKFAYHFLWFDADGNTVESDTTDIPRSTIPGDPIRFVGHAPTEECRDFALILRMADKNVAEKYDEEDADEEQADKAEEAELKAETEEAVENAEMEAGESYVVPPLRQENVSDTNTDVKVIGVSDKDAGSDN